MLCNCNYCANKKIEALQHLHRGYLQPQTGLISRRLFAILIGELQLGLEKRSASKGNRTKITKLAVFYQPQHHQEVMHYQTVYEVSQELREKKRYMLFHIHEHLSPKQIKRNYVQLIQSNPAILNLGSEKQLRWCGFEIADSK